MSRGIPVRPAGGCRADYGHEAAASSSAWSQRAGLCPGDRICLDSTVYCNRCPACRQGLFNRCVKRQVLGVSVPEFKRRELSPSSWPYRTGLCSDARADVVVQRRCWSRLIGTHAAIAAIAKDDTVVVVGPEHRLFILQAAKLRGAQRTVACDLNEFRLGLARQVGADVCVNPGKVNLREEIQKQTTGAAPT